MQDPAAGATGARGQSRGMGTLSLPCCHKSCSPSAGRLPVTWLPPPTVSNQLCQDEARAKATRGTLPCCCQRGWGFSEAEQLLSPSIPWFPWEQYFEDSSAFWTTVTVTSFRKRSSRVKVSHASFLTVLHSYFCVQLYIFSMEVLCNAWKVGYHEKYHCLWQWRLLF